MMTATFKALSALLSYPSAELQEATGALLDAVRGENLVRTPSREALEHFAGELAAADLYEAQEHYVDLFDKTRRLSLHLFEHVHGESRDRGQAMVDLARLYEAGGLELTANELPDYLPLFLEYLSTRPLAEARAVLADAMHIVGSLEERLSARKSGYAAVFSAIRSAAGTDAALPVAVAEVEPEDGDLAALDAAWEESAVTFGPGEAAADGCSVDRLKIRMRAGRRDVRRAEA